MSMNSRHYAATALILFFLAGRIHKVSKFRPKSFR